MDQPQRQEAPHRGRGRPRSASIDQRVLDAALDLLVEAGPGAVNIDAVARRTGASRAAIYRRWRHADELLWSAMDQALMTAAGRTHLGPPYSPDGMEFDAAVRQLVRRLAEIFSEKRFGASYLALVTARRQDSTAQQSLERYTTRMVDGVAAMLGGSMQGMSSSPRVVADLIVGLVVYKVLIEGVALTPETIDATAGMITAGAMA
jgi:AcrR family transcriptional regulator